MRDANSFIYIGSLDFVIVMVFFFHRLSGCQDDLYTCHIWAAKGECSTNKVWMKQNCKRSCHVCGGKAKTVNPSVLHVCIDVMSKQVFRLKTNYKT